MNKNRSNRSNPARSNKKSKLGGALLKYGIAAGIAGTAAFAAGKYINGLLKSKPRPQAAPDGSSDGVLEAVIGEFLKLTKIPRKSGHEDKIAEYLLSWAERRELKHIKDEYGNVIIEKDASAGYEKAPTVILQAHMDMVCLSDGEDEYDPLSDPIKPIKTAEMITAHGTTLGADDGIGIAEILYILNSGLIKHGPIRAIFTVSEETDMYGAANIDEKYLDADYMINIDNEDEGQICNSCSNNAVYSITKDIERVEPSGDAAYEIKLCGLRGGHSGMDINSGAMNAVSALAYVLSCVKQAGIDLEFSSLEGGTATNAIPASASAVVVINEERSERFTAILKGMLRSLSDAYCYTEPNFDLSCQKLDYVPTPVVSADDSAKLIDLLSSLPNGVNTMSPAAENLVESSANIGIIRIEPDMINIGASTRSSVDTFSEVLDMRIKTAARLTGFDLEILSSSPSWPLNPYGKLAELYKRCYNASSGRTAETAPIHASVECCYFCKKNPDLDIISVGPTITGAHSVGETLYLDSVKNNIKAIILTLEKLK